MNLESLLPIVAMIAVFVFFIILPKNKEVKKAKEFLANLKTGDKVITIAGIHGKISEIGETTFVIETMSGKLKIEKSAISAEMTLKLNQKK